MTGPKISLLDHLVVLLQAGDDGRLEEEAGVADWRVPPAATSAWSGAPVDEAADVRELVGVVDRAEQHVLVVGHAGLGVLSACSVERGDEVVVDAGPGEHAGRRGAVLAGVEVAGDRDALGGGGDVGVVEHDDRRLAAELEVHPLEVARGGARPPPCRPAPSR